MKDIHELYRFFRDNEAYLIDQYKAGKLKRVLYHFHEYLKKRANEDKEYLTRWNLQLMKNEPQLVTLESILSVDPKRKTIIEGESQSIQSTFL